MTSSGLTFPRATVLNAILTQKNHFLCIESYLNQLKAGISSKLPLPMLSMAGNGATVLSINQGLFLSPDFSQAATIKKSLRLTLSTIGPADQPFDPRAQTDVDIIKAMPVSDTINAKIPSITDLMNAETEEEVHDILSAPISSSSHAKTIQTSIIIPPALLEQIITDRCGNPIQTLVSTLAWMRSSCITRGPKRGKTTASVVPHTRAIIAFMALQYKIFSHLEGDDEESFLCDDALKACAPSILTSFSSDERIACETFKGEALIELGVVFDQPALTTNSPADSTTAQEEVQQQSTPAVSSHPSSSSSPPGTSGQEKANQAPVAKVIQPSSQAPPATKPQQQQQQQQQQQHQNTSTGNGSGAAGSSTGKVPGAGVGTSTMPAPSSQAPPPQAPQATTVDKDQATIDLLQALTKQVLASSSGSTSASKMGFAHWDPITQQAVLALTSPDPSIPATAPCPELLEFCKEATGTRMAQKCVTKYPTYDFTPDIALFGNIKKGNFVMNEVFWQGVKVTGLSPLSCPPKIVSGSGKDHSMTMAKIDLYVTHAVANTLTQDDIRSLSCQSFFIPLHELQLLSVMENYSILLDICFSEKAYLSIKVKKLFKAISTMRAQLHQYIGKYGGNFTLSLVGTIHTAIAIYINSILADPSSASMGMLDLEVIEKHLKMNTFMNVYVIPLISGDNEIKIASSASADPIPADSNNKRQNNDDRKSNKPQNSKKTKIVNPHIRDTQSTAVDVSELCKAIRAITIDGLKPPTIDNVSVCNNFHTRGVCSNSCPRKKTHIKLVGKVKHDYCHFIERAEKVAIRNKAGN